MTVHELIMALHDHGAILTVVGDRLRFRGPRLSLNDPLRAAINEHRDALMRLLTSFPAGWSDRLGRQVYEPAPGRTDCWRETATSAMLCIFCSRPLAPGDKIACPEHRRRLDSTVCLSSSGGREAYVSHRPDGRRPLATGSSATGPRGPPLISAP